MRDIDSMYGYRANEKGLDFEAVIEPGTPLEIYSDAHRVRQILYNLVGNAIKFTESGSVALRIQGSKHNENYADLHISVSDSGIGIHPNEKERIFDAFTQQSGQEESFGGTGLGLTITRRLAEAMGGAISVQSALGKGSTFVVHFPHMKLTGGDIAGENAAVPVAAEPFGQPKIPAVFEEFDFSIPLNRKTELIEWLEGTGKEQWERISDTLFMDDIRDFSQSLQNRGLMHQAQGLKHYGEKLEGHVTTLNLAALKRYLHYFPALVDQLRRAPQA